MGTTIRPELSEKSKYWIEKHRYYELKHFCLQYPIWKKAYVALDGWSGNHGGVIEQFKKNGISNPTEKCAEARLFYSERIDLIERIAQETNPELSSYIIKSVTTGTSFDHLKARLEIPCCMKKHYLTRSETFGKCLVRWVLTFHKVTTFVRLHFCFRYPMVASVSKPETTYLL